MREIDDADEGHGFDPVAFAEHWYEEVWPVRFPNEHIRYVTALKTLGRWDEDEI